MVSKYEDFHKLKDQIKNLETARANGSLTNAQIDYAQQFVDQLAKKYKHDSSVGTDYYLLYELQGLIHEANGHDSEAEKFIQDAVRIKGDANLVSTGAKNIFISGASGSPSISPSSSSVQDTPDNTQKLKNTDKIAGWLAVVGLGVIFVPFINLFGLFEYFDLLNEIDGLGYLGLEFLLYFEMFFSVLAAVAFFIYWFFFFPKKQAARQFGIYLYGTIFAIGIADIIAAYVIFNDLGLFDNTAEIFGSAIRDIIATGIWWAYFIKSERVKQTFVN